MPDFVYVDSEHRWTALNGRNGEILDVAGFPPGHRIAGFPCWGRYFFADFTGNGIQDRAYLREDGKWFVTDGTNGGPGVPGIPWGDQPTGWPGLGRFACADFDGDGIAERCYLHSDGSWYMVDQNGSPGVGNIPYGQQIPGWPGNGHYLINDFDGDGKVDRIYIHPGDRDGRWYFVSSASGAPGSTSIPWGSTIPGWPGGGRYIALDFNGNGAADRCYVHPEGRLYIVDSMTGAPMNTSVPEVSDPWGGRLTDIGQLMIDIIAFEAAAVGCTLGVATSPTGIGAAIAWSGCLGVLGLVNPIIDRLKTLTERNRNREKEVITKQGRHPGADLDRERYYRAYPPETSTSNGGADFNLGTMTLHAQKNAKELDLPDCPSSSGGREDPDEYCRADRPGRIERPDLRRQIRFVNPMFIFDE